MAKNRSTQMPAGPSSDAEGRPSKDPSPNVLDLVRAESRYQNGMRKLEARALRREAKMRAEHERELRVLNNERLKAIREVDVKSGADAAQQTIATASTLATQVSTTADAQRSATADVATAVEAKIRSEVDPLKKDISELRQSQYEGVGAKAQVVETRSSVGDDRPILDAIAKLTAAQDQAAGGRAQVVQTQAKSSNLGLWIGLGVAAFVGVSGLFLTLVGTAVAVFALTR